MEEVTADVLEIAKELEFKEISKLGFPGGSVAKNPPAMQETQV